MSNTYMLTLAQIENLKPTVDLIAVDWSSEIKIINYDESITDLTYVYEVEALSDDARLSLEAQTKDEYDQAIYSIRDHEAGNPMVSGLTLAEAQEELEKFVKADKQEKVYTPNFYEIYNNVNGEIVEIA